MLQTKQFKENNCDVLKVWGRDWKLLEGGWDGFLEVLWVTSLLAKKANRQWNETSFHVNVLKTYWKILD